ncbi:hypothetical protein CL689_02025 [Candidatus Saccharibacteria bacterium]|nr:hypothetical protein [Candidatus Saccharibacteria bacterium]|tara:strand:- start:2866 stop:3591 length:726 start_codon:yes stop_codon:yes gene_type:complete
MRVAIDAAGEVVSRHLPPVEQSLLLTVANNGRVKAIEKLDTPVDEYGVPDPYEYLGRLAVTLDDTYEPPKPTNVHHLIHPRADYARHGRDSVQYRYRESPSLMLEIPIQIHNYGHWVMLPPKMPPFEVMEQRVKEQEQVDRLFRIGRAVIAAPRWLDEMHGRGAQLYRTAETYVSRHEPTEAQFFDELDKMDDGVLGLMPNRQDLADMGLPAATRYLGVLAGANSLTLRREARASIRRYGL